MTGPREEPHPWMAAACFFAVLALVAIDVIGGVL